MSDALSLPSKLDLSTVTGLYDELVARKDQDVTLDLCDVTHFGALSLQVVIAASRQAKSVGKTFALLNVSDRVGEQLNSMGVTPETLMEGQI